MTFFSALTSKIYGALCVGLLCFLVAMMLANAGLKAKVGRLETTVGNLRVDLRQCQDNRRELEAGIARQNAAVTALKADRDRVAREGEKAVRDARGVAESYRQRAERVLRARAGVDQCVSADRVILESLR